MLNSDQEESLLTRTVEVSSSVICTSQSLKFIHAHQEISHELTEQPEHLHTTASPPPRR